MWYNNAEKMVLPDNQYFRERTAKKQIVLHHTVSPSNSVVGDVNWWKSDPDRVGTHFLIDSLGRVYQTIDTDFWIHHIAVSKVANKVHSKYKTIRYNDFLNKQSIGIELDNAGGLTKIGANWRSSFNTTVAPDNVQEFYPNGFRGFYGFEKYSEIQVAALEQLLLWLQSNLGIKLNWHDNRFDIQSSALDGLEGIFTHVSYRTDKSDCHPDSRLKTMLNKICY